MYIAGGRPWAVNVSMALSSSKHPPTNVVFVLIMRSSTLLTKLQPSTAIDVVFILNYCYSGTVARGTPAGVSRTVQVVATCEERKTALGNDSQIARIQNRTFTFKLGKFETDHLF